MFAAIIYNMARNHERAFTAMTSLRVSEFDKLNTEFKHEFEDKYGKNTFSPIRKGRPRILSSIAQHLFFVLFYLKCYPLQEVIGFLFGLSQSRANEIIHDTLPLLNKTLIRLGHAPIRINEALQQELQQSDKTIIVDGTDRPVQRPQNNEIQKNFILEKRSVIP